MIPQIVPHRHRHIDPITGDELSSGEYVSWLIQSIIRRWLFLGIITAATIAVWATGNPVALQWWNLAASYLALVIESIVGIAMFSQTRRDAVVIREIRALSKALLKDVEEIEENLEEPPPGTGNASSTSSTGDTTASHSHRNSR